MEEFRRFNPEGSVLRLHQMRMLSILKFVDGVCRKHKINYWLSSGTLLGAVRHSGFIPWDDDLDIEMLKSDYDKLMKVLPPELPENLILQTTYTDKNYVAPYSKLRETNSSISEVNNIGTNYKYNGIYIDIFYLEPMPYFLSWFASKLHGYIYLLSYKKNDDMGIKKWIMRSFLFLLNRVLYPLLRFVSKLLHPNELRLGLGSGFMGARVMNDIFPLKKMNFEGSLFWVPCNSDGYLTRLYGNYMKLPDLDKLSNHINEINIDK